MPRDPQLEGAIHAPEFSPDTVWLNTPEPLSFERLKGKVVLLDFWTYCCINCLHVLPELDALERKYASELVVIGVHSAKFTAEKTSEAIEAAIARYGIRHPVINDRDFAVWQQYSVRAWPSFMLINPIGRIIGTHSGEGIYKLFDTMIRKTVTYFDRQGAIDRTPIPLLQRSPEPAALRYPGKVHIHPETRGLYIADTGHNRILITDLEGHVQDTIGSGEPGLRDGGFGTCALNAPQGLVRSGTYLYFCDTGNHTVRVADFEKRVVTTLFGTGEQARMPNVAGQGTDVRLNSPWDVTMVGDDLYVAMAGPHQIWKLGTRTLKAEPYAGSGREDLEDAALLSAALAQPSGITTDGEKLYFADSEVSAIRSADLDPTGYVKTLVGKGLFDFGDIEGDTRTARLQHPLDVTIEDDLLYVADTYNARIKTLDPTSGILRSLAGTGEPGFADGSMSEARFNEPSGITCHDRILYVADTNNHAIRRVDLDRSRITTLNIE